MGPVAYIIRLESCNGVLELRFYLDGIGNGFGKGCRPCSWRNDWDFRRSGRVRGRGPSLLAVAKSGISQNEGSLNIGYAGSGREERCAQPQSRKSAMLHFEP